MLAHRPADLLPRVRQAHSWVSGGGGARVRAWRHPWPKRGWPAQASVVVVGPTTLSETGCLPRLVSIGHPSMFRKPGLVRSLSVLV